MAAGSEIAKQLADMRKQLTGGKLAAAERLENFKKNVPAADTEFTHAEAIAKEIEKDPDLRKLLTDLRLKWREQRRADPLDDPLLARKDTQREIIS